MVYPVISSQSMLVCACCVVVQDTHILFQKNETVGAEFTNGRIGTWLEGCLPEPQRITGENQLALPTV